MEGRVSEPGVTWEFEVAQRIAMRRGSADKLDRNGNVWKGDITSTQERHESLTLASIVEPFRRYYAGCCCYSAIQ